MLNIVAINGRLTADPELRTTGTGTQVCSFTVAVDRSFVRTGEERQADFIDVVAWRGTAEFICKYFHKGSMIAIDGTLQTRSYEDKNGIRRKSTEIVASNVNFCGSKNESGTSYRNDSAPAYQPQAAFTTADEGDFKEIPEEDDLPF